MRLADAVICTGYVQDKDVAAYLGAADIVSCLRWPSARETSASWLRAIAAGRPTIVTDLAQQTDVPTLDPRSWTVLDAAPEKTVRSPIAVSIDVLDEDHSLTLALKRLIGDRTLRTRLGAAAAAHWRATHTVEHMAEDYERLLSAPIPSGLATGQASELPPHLRRDGLEHARSLLASFSDQITFPLP
jgi:glycosyltransferase involved in cell wall biosynthesis